VPTDEPSPRAGWYPDPYGAGSLRWFDGTVWTIHDVSADAPRPDAVVESTWKGSAPEEMRERERFPASDLTIPRDGERAYDGGGGWQGLYANRVARGVTRAGTRWGPASATRWLAGLTLVLALLAWGDHRHRLLLVALAVPCLVGTVIVGIREIRERARWKELGKSD
jgi:Flp pilus assembly protein TadB